jgi:hypothetical protein
MAVADSALQESSNSRFAPGLAVASSGRAATISIPSFGYLASIVPHDGVSTKRGVSSS